jgi:hypothetical protein
MVSPLACRSESSQTFRLVVGLPSTQHAAVSTCLGLVKVPPQKILVLDNPTTKGPWSSVASVPPTMAFADLVTVRRREASDRICMMQRLFVFGNCNKWLFGSVLHRQGNSKSSCCRKVQGYEEIQITCLGRVGLLLASKYVRSSLHLPRSVLNLGDHSRSIIILHS